MVSFTQVSPPKPCIRLSSPTNATGPTHLILLYFITWTILGEKYKSLSSSLCSFLHSPVTLSLLCPNIPLGILFSNTLTLRSYLNVSDQVSHLYKIRGKIIFLYILTFKLLIANWKAVEYNIMRKFIIFTPHRVIRVFKSRRVRLAGNGSHMEEKRNGGDPARRRPPRRSRCRWRRPY